MELGRAGWDPGGDPHITSAIDASAEGAESTGGIAMAWGRGKAEQWSVRNEGQHMDSCISPGPGKPSRI